MPQAIILEPRDLSARPEPAEPFSVGDLKRAAVRPHLIVEYVLGGGARLARNLSLGRGLWLLAPMLLVTSLIATVPYGWLSPTQSMWRIAVLFTGSLLICFPCLHTFAQFLGFRFNLAQNLTLALVISGVAAIFLLGFAPIIWFIDYTTSADLSTSITPHHLSVFLLSVSLLMGIIQMGRCLGARGGMGREAKPFPLLIVLWLPLLLFITYRMAALLAIL